jgi:hypothetical protein
LEGANQVYLIGKKNQAKRFYGEQDPLGEYPPAYKLMGSALHPKLA